MENLNRAHFIMFSPHDKFCKLEKVTLTVNMLYVENRRIQRKHSICNFITHYDYLYIAVSFPPRPFMYIIP